jgi:hypothetical protein
MGRWDDRTRLARVFGFEPVRPIGPLVGTGICAGMAAFPVAGGLVVGLLGLMAYENHRIAVGLREVEGWGFPVMGYREWLLAYEPAFDLELKRDVALDLITASLAAVDRAIAVERRGERVVRVRMARIEVEGGPKDARIPVGDRKRLLEVRDRVLAPLHADVGIVAVRMGEDATLAALTAGPVSVQREAAFRDQGMHAPPELQALVHKGTTQLAPPKEARSLRVRVDRLLYATGHVPTAPGTLTWSFLGCVIIASIFLGAGVGFLAGGALGSGAVLGLRVNDRRRAERALRRLRDELGCPVEGYEDWLLSGRPIIDVELWAAPDRAFCEQLLREDAIAVTWLSDKVLRIETAPTMHMAAQGIQSFWGGNPAVLLRVMKALRGYQAIVSVRMGGYLDRRA